MRKVVRLVVVLCLTLSAVLPVSGVITAQDGNCDVQSAVLIVTLGSGINCLDGDGWGSFELESDGIPVSSIDDIAVCPDDGSILALHIFGINKFDGSGWTDVEVPSEVFAPNAVACGVGGDIWVAHTSGVSHFSGGEWTTVADDELGTSPFIIGAKDVAASIDGSAWVTTSNSVAHYVDGTWEIFEEGSGFDQDYSIGDLALNSDGLPIIVYSDGLLTYDGSGWETNSAPITLLQKVTVDSNGRVWVGSLIDGLAVLDDGNWTTYTREEGLSSNAINALASDSQGRIWVGTGWGLNVLDGDQWSVFQMANSDLLDNNVQQINILGEGAALPEVVEKAPGSIIGALVTGRDPAPNLQVELCTESVGGIYYGNTPCEGQVGQMLTTTDENGEFSFTDVPVGRYDIAFETPDGWIYFIGIDAKVEVTEGQENDLAFIDISG